MGPESSWPRTIPVSLCYDKENHFRKGSFGDSVVKRLGDRGISHYLLGGEAVINAVVK